jgi:hypothetical protein
MLGVAACRRAQTYPAHVAPQRLDTIIRLKPLADPFLMLTQTVAAQVFRNREIRRPITIIFAVNLLGSWFVGTDQQQMSVLLTIPIAVGAAFAANMFGLLGPGLPWLATQPNLMRRLPAAAFPIQIVLSLALCTLCWMTMFTRHVLDPSASAPVTTTDVVRLVLASGAIAALLARAAFAHSIKHPAIVRTGGRGATIVRPGSAISFTLKNVLGVGAAGLAIIESPNLAISSALTAAVCCWAAIRWFQPAKEWSNPIRRAHIVHQVAA